MKIIPLTPKTRFTSESKAAKSFDSFRQLIEEINQRELPDKVIDQINPLITEVNQAAETEPSFVKLLKKSAQKITRVLEKELKIVPKRYYLTIWMAVGMSAFGLPLGTAFGLMIDNLAFMGIFLPVGMAIGIGIGMQMDKKAKVEGRQLNIEMTL